MPGKSVVPANDDRPYQKMLAYMRERAEVTAEEFDAEVLTADQVDRIMTASTEDELFKAMETAGLTGLKDLEDGARIRIHSYRLVTGTMGVGVYAVLEADDPDTGEVLQLDTGVPRILAFLRMCEVLGKFPVTVEIVKKATASGNTLITLKKDRKRAVPSTTE